MSSGSRSATSRLPMWRKPKCDVSISPLERLQPIATALHQLLGHVGGRQQRHLDSWQWRRRLLACAHINPDETIALRGAISPCFDLAFEILVSPHARHIDAIASRVELPTVIDAAYAMLLVAAQEQRGTAVRTPLVHHADPPGGVAEGD